MEKLNPAKINDVWNKYIIDFEDAIGSNKEDFENFRAGLNDNNGIIKAIEDEKGLLEKHASFFNLYDYAWCFQPEAYRYTAEAYFQFRLLKILISSHESGKDLNLAEPVIVRQAVVTGTMLQPIAVFRDGLSFIFIPLGWISYTYVAAYGLEVLEKGQVDIFANILYGWSSKVFAQEAIDKFIDDYPDKSISPLLYTYLILELSNYIIAEVGQLSDGIATITEEMTEDLTHLISYSCISFVLAHELAHICAGEHKIIPVKANEVLADDLALDLLIVAHKDIIGADIGVSTLTIPWFAILSFVFVSLAYFHTQSHLESPSSEGFVNYRQRVFSLADRVNSSLPDLPEEDSKKIQYFLILVNYYLENCPKPILSFIGQKSQIVEIAYSKIGDFARSHEV